MMPKNAGGRFEIEIEAGLGSLSSTAVIYFGSELWYGWFAHIFTKIIFACHILSTR